MVQLSDRLLNAQHMPDTMLKYKVDWWLMSSLSMMTLVENCRGINDVVTLHSAVVVHLHREEKTNQYFPSRPFWTASPQIMMLRLSYELALANLGLFLAFFFLSIN